MFICDFRSVVAQALVVTTVFVTMPVSAADFSTTRSIVGSVSAVGPVDLRGVAVVQEGTVFSGDRIRAGQNGYAKVLLGNGSKIEVSEKTDINVDRDAHGLKLAMNAGTIGFTAHSSLRIALSPFEVTASDDASGNVAIMASGVGGVRAIKGKITVRNLKTAESFVLANGQERLLGLRDGRQSPVLAEIASNVPGPIPGPVPQAPAGRTTGGLAMDTGAWLAVIGGAAVAGVAIWGLVVALGNRDDLDDLRASNNALNSTIAANNAALRNLTNANNISTAVSQLQAQQAQVALLAAQAQLALATSGNIAGAQQAANLANQSNALQTQLNTLQSQIQAAQVRLASGTGSAADVTALLQQEEALRAQANTLAANLNALLTQNANTPNIPSSRVSPVGGPSQISASIPV